MFGLYIISVVVFFVCLFVRECGGWGSGGRTGRSKWSKQDDFNCQLDEDLDTRTDSNERDRDTWNHHYSNRTATDDFACQMDEDLDTSTDSDESDGDTWDHDDSNWTEADDFACQMDADLDD